MESESKKKIKLRLEFIHKPVKNPWYRKAYPFLIQNEPFEYGLRVKNIGDTVSSITKIEDFRISLRNSQNLQFTTSKEVRIKALNINEESEIYFDKLTLWHEGSMSMECRLKPSEPNEEIMTYRYDRFHNVDEEHKINLWMDDFYCQSKQQLLQTRTNNLILLLTLITVLEAVFGLNDILKFFSSGLAFVFNELSLFFSWLAGN